MSIDQNQRFANFIGKTLKFEGAATDDGTPHTHPSDPGLATQWGLSARWNPEVAEDINRGQLSFAKAMDIYYSKYYIRLPLIDQIDERVAFILFDANVHGGYGRTATTRVIQFTINVVDGKKLAIDGLYGPMTATAILHASDLAIDAILNVLAALETGIARRTAGNVEKQQKRMNLAVLDYSRGFENRLRMRREAISV